ncbi:retrovirus-related pol polyprotein from transposon TNT 1-94 [Tanacetum coccineum]
MADPASPDHLLTSPDHVHVSPDHAPTLLDHIPGSPEIVAASPHHVFAFPDDDISLDIKEDQNMDIDEEDQEMDFDDEDDEWEDDNDWLMVPVTHLRAASLTRSNTPPLPLSTRAPLVIDPVMLSDYQTTTSDTTPWIPPTLHSDYQVLHLYLADKPKDNTLTGSVPSQDVASRCKVSLTQRIQKKIERLKCYSEGPACLLPASLEGSRKLSGRYCDLQTVVKLNSIYSLLVVDEEVRPVKRKVALRDYVSGDMETSSVLERPESCMANQVVQIVLWYLDSGCSKHMIGDRSQLTNFIHKFLGTVKFGNDQVAKIIGYGDYQIGNVTISRVYYVEGLGHNLFSVGQFCNSDLEVAFRKHTCFVRNLEGVDLLLGSQGTNLYSLSIGDMLVSSPICLLSKGIKTKSWLWHQHPSHLNFSSINHLARHGLVRGLPRLKFEKDHLFSACAMGKSKKRLHKPKSEDTNQEKLYLLHMDLCGPMRVASVNGKKYILDIVDDYSWFTWVKFLASKDEAPDFIIKFLKMIQVRLNAIAEAVAIACHTKNRSIIHRHHGKTPYELLHERKPDLSYLRVFGALCYPTNDSENLGKLQAKADIGLVPNPPPSAPFIPPSRHEWDLMFQPVFDEFFSPPASVASLVPEVPVLAVDAQAPIESTGIPSSTTVDQDAPSLSTSQTCWELRSSIKFILLAQLSTAKLKEFVLHRL